METLRRLRRQRPRLAALIGLETCQSAARVTAAVSAGNVRV